MKRFDHISSTDNLVPDEIAPGADGVTDESPARDRRMPARERRTSKAMRGQDGDHAPPMVINIAALQTAGVLVTGDSGATASDEYRRIKLPLLGNAFGKGMPAVERGNLIMVTSSLSGEGKTYTSINLALSMAQERNESVVLVDADILKADTSRLLDVRSRPGLTDLLFDESLTIDELLIPTDTEKLKILPAGGRRSNSAELLSSRRMQALTDEFHSRYPDHAILFDAPPLLLTVEAQILASMMGQIAVVVEAARTPQEALQEALEKLDRNTVIGLILNKGQRWLDSYYYYYGGYYRHVE